MLPTTFKKLIREDKSMKQTKFLVFMLMAIFLLTLVIAQTESLGSSKVKQKYEFCQVCEDATYVTLTSIKTPTGNLQLNTNMTLTGSGQFCYNYTPTEIGRYDFKGISNGCEKSFATYLDVTPSGFQGTSTFYFIMLLIMAGLLVLGFGIKEEWFVVLGGLGLIMMGLYSINYGVAGFKDMFMTWGIGLFQIGVGAVLSIGAAWQKIEND